MKLFTTFLSGIFLFPLLSAAQSNYKPGYAVTLKGDTIKGYIDYQEWDTNPSSVNFKAESLTARTQKLDETNTTFFTITGMESYLRYSGRISRDEIKESRISGGRDTSFKMANVFLRILQTGKNISLYSYADVIKTRFYYTEPGTTVPQELVYHTYFSANPNDNNKTIDENRYIQQLSAVALKNNVFDDKLQRLFEIANYSKVSILKIVSYINGIAPSEQTLQGSNKAVNLYAGLGLNYTKFTVDGNYAKAGGTGASSIFPKATIGLNAYANPNTQRLVFKGEVSVTLNKYKSLYNNKVSPQIPVEYSFSQAVIGLSPQIIYNFYNAEDFKFFAGAGMEFQLYTYSNKKFQGQDGTNIQTGLAPFYFAKNDNPVVLKAGVLLKKKFQISAEYLTASQITMDPYFQLSSTSIRIGLCYMLF
jgi:hypothetical protein